MDGREYIETTLNFAAPHLRGFRAPGGYTSQHDRPPKGAGGGPTKVTVYNARLLDPPPTLDSHGFQLMTHPPVTLDLLDMDVVKGEYYEECRRLIKEATGCDEVRGGSNEFRRPPGLPTPNGSGGGFASGIHSDMSPGIELGWEPGQDDRHFQSINVWRSAEGPEHNIEMMPLCLCAMDTVAEDDVVYGDGQNTGDVRQYYKLVDERCVHSPQQRWYYFPNMTPAETLLFRQYDTREEAPVK